MVGSDAVKGEGWKRRPGHGDLVVADAAVLSLSLFCPFPTRSERRWFTECEVMGFHGALTKCVS